MTNKTKKITYYLMICFALSSLLGIASNSLPQKDINEFNIIKKTWPQKNKHWYDSLLNVYNTRLQSNDYSKIQKINYRFIKAFLLEHSAKFNEALKEYDRSYNEFTLIGDYEKAFDCLIVLSRFKSGQSKLEDAFNYLQKADELYTKKRLQNRKRQILDLYAAVYMAMGKADSAIAYYKKSMVEDLKISPINYSHYTNILGNISSCYQELYYRDSIQTAIDSAIKYINASIKLSKGVDSLIQTYHFSSLKIAEINLIIGKYKEAEKIITDFDTTNVNVYTLGFYNYLLGQLYLETERYDEMISVAKKGIELEHEYFKQSSSLQSYYRMLVHAYKEKKQADSALRYSELLNDQENFMNVSALEQLKEKNKIKEELSKAEEESGILEGKLTYAIIGITGLGILIVVLTIFLRRQLGHRRALTLLKQNWNSEINQMARDNAKLTLNLAEKQNLNEQIIKELRSTSYNLQGEELQNVNRIIRAINASNKEDFWKSFELYFGKIHTSFFEKIEQDFPNLTPNEKRLCAFLKMNLTTKDIAALTYRSIQTIEKQRTKLRAKFNISNSSVSLTEFVSQF